MQRLMPTPPARAEVLQAGGRGGTGNVLYYFRDAHPPAVLKVYRTRRSRSRESLKNFAERRLEGKRGATAELRCATERLSIDLWSREGFDVVQLVERPLPSSVTSPALWLVHYGEPRLWDVLTDRQGSMATKLALVESLGFSLSRRHARAEELQEPLLVHEHGHIKHFFVQGHRLIAFDLEHGFKPGYPVVKAVAREVAGIAYSLVRADGAATGRWLRAFTAGYVNKALLKQAVREAIHGGGFVGKVRRWRGLRRGLSHDKTRIMAQLGALLEFDAGRLTTAGRASSENLLQTQPVIRSSGVSARLV